MNDDVVAHTLPLVASLAVLTFGATILVRGGAGIARRLGLSPLLIGLTVVAFGTSAPEMVVTVGGALEGRGDVALGNVVGSNIFNIGVILGLSVLLRPIRIQFNLLRIDAPFMIGVSLIAVGFAFLATIPRWAGVVLLALLVAYTVFAVRLARTAADAVVAEEFDAGLPNPTRSVAVEVALVVGGLGLLVGGADVLVSSAVSIARDLGAGDAVIGLTIVAAGTSLPELATSLVAAIRRQPDIAVGNVIGSNIFNVLGTLGLAASVRPLTAPGIGTLDLGVMMAFSIGLLPLLWTGRRLLRWEGAILLIGYAAYVWARWPG